jgi:hypothetical protein
VLALDAAARSLALRPQMCLESARRMPGFGDARVGDDALDRWCAAIVELLEREELRQHDEAAAVAGGAGAQGPAAAFAPLGSPAKEPYPPPIL